MSSGSSVRGPGFRCAVFGLRRCVVQVILYGAAFVCMAGASSAQGSFELIEFASGGLNVASGVSDDGAAVIGWGTPPGTSVPRSYRWTELGGVQVIGDTMHAYDLSADGSIVVGSFFGEDGPLPFRWTGGAPTFLAGPGSVAAASADAAVLVGRAYDDDENDWAAAKWDPGLALLRTPGDAGDVSADGSVIVGHNGEIPLQALVWVDGVMQNIGDGTAGVVSDDGSAVFGVFVSSGAQHTFRWTLAGGREDLGPWIAGASTVDGSIAVGRRNLASGSEATYWTQAGGLRPLAGVLAGLGIVVPAGVTLINATDITPDGRVIVGTAQVEPVVGFGSPTVVFRAVLDGQCALLAGGPASLFDSALIAWTASGSGNFSDDLNWAGEEAPGPDSVAVFNQGADPFTVTMSEFVTNDAVVATELVDVRMALAGQTYDLTGAVGCFEGSLAVLRGARNELQGGTVLAHADVLIDPALANTDTELVVGQGATLIIDSDQDAEGTLNVAGAATGEPVASVAVRDGGQLVNRNEAHVGQAGSGPGELIVEGAGSRLTDGYLVVHGGEVAIRNGGVVDVDGLLVGDVPSDTAEVTIEATGRLLTAEGAIVGQEAGAVGRLVLNGPGAEASLDVLGIGQRGAGAALLLAGTRLTVSGQGTVIAVEPGSAGSLTMVDAEADLGIVGVGVRGTGLLHNSGSQLTASALHAGAESGGDGTVTITGSTAVALVLGDVTLGRNGTATLSVLDQATVVAARVLIYPGGSFGTIDGTIAAGWVGPVPAQPATGDTGVYMDTLTVYEGARMHLDTLIVRPAGVIGGGGEIPLPFVNGGTIAPADTSGGPGTFRAAGLTFAQGAALEVDLFGAGAGQFDRLDVAGSLALAGTLRIAFGGGFLPAPGQVFELVSAGALAGGFDVIEGPPGSSFEVTYSPTAVTITVLTVDDEPAPEIPTALTLYAPAPNPAGDRITLRYHVPTTEQGVLAVYDAIGRQVLPLVEGVLPAGAREVTVDVSRLAPGLYVVHLKSASGLVTRRVSISR